VASPRSSNSPHLRARGVGVVGVLLLASCATVKPQDKELLADPAMVYGSGGAAEVQEAHVLENRQGGNEGGARGGGCGCN
jgi:hypothetical protein